MRAAIFPVSRPPVAKAPAALISHIGMSSPDGNGFTTPAIDTTGAKILVAHLGCYSANVPTVSDSKANIWITLTPHIPTGGPYSVLIYSKNPVVGTGHTFSVSGTANYPALCVATFSGINTTSPFDVENGGNANNSVLTQPVGLITPSLDGSLIVAGLSEYTGFGEPITIDSGLVILDKMRFTSGLNFGSWLAYKIQTTKAAINPAWSWSASGADRGFGDAAFKAG